MVQYSGRFLPETTLPKTNSSAMKMGHPKRKRKSIPTIHFQVRTVSFRKGTLLPHGISNFWTFSTPSDSAMQLAQMATLVVPDAAAKKTSGSLEGQVMTSGYMIQNPASANEVTMCMCNCK